MKLLSKNYKMEKDSKYPITGLSLAPATHSGRNVCPQSTKSCRDVCVLWFRGRTVMPNVRDAMIRRAQWLFEDQSAFLSQLHKEIGKLKETSAIRLNVASDLAWEKIDSSLFNYNHKFYDYTKVLKRAEKYASGSFHPNYQLTYSWNERSDKRKVNQLLKKGMNVAIVHDTPYDPQRGVIGELPKGIKIGTKWHETVDGDQQDARLKEIDGEGKVVLLRAKMRKDQLDEYVGTGFVVRGTRI